VVTLLCSISIRRDPLCLFTALNKKYKNQPNSNKDQRCQKSICMPNESDIWLNFLSRIFCFLLLPPSDRCRRYKLIRQRLGRRMRLVIFPEFTVAENLFYKRFILDKRDNYHLPAAPGTFQRINTSAGSVHRFVNQFYQFRPSDAR